MTGHAGIGEMCCNVAWCKVALILPPWRWLFSNNMISRCFISPVPQQFANDDHFLLLMNDTLYYLMVYSSIECLFAFRWTSYSHII